MPNFLRGGTRVFASPETPARIVAHLDADDGTVAPKTPDETNRSDNYLSTLLKLIPAEVVSVYVAFRDSLAEHGALAMWFWICIAPSRCRWATPTRAGSGRCRG